MTIIEAVENLRKAWVELLQAIDAELHITERVQKLIRKTYKYEWQTPPKHTPTANTTCINIMASRLGYEAEYPSCETCRYDEPNNPKCDECIVGDDKPSNYEPQTDCAWGGRHDR